MKELSDNTARSGKKWPEGVLEDACGFTPHRPFFWRILIDDLQRIYLWRVRSVLERTEINKLDVFSNEGQYFYQAEVPVDPQIICNGFLYKITEDENTGEIAIRKFKIKNWDRIRATL